MAACHLRPHQKMREIHDTKRVLQEALVTFLLLAGMLLARAALSLRPMLARVRYVEPVLDVAVMACVMFGVFVFLRPISQFIYFQF
jgi:hypothetical protein